MIHAGRTAKRFILIFGDFFVLEGALLLTLLARYGTLSGGLLEAHLLPFTILTVLWILGLYVAGLYELSIGQQPFRLLRTYIEGMMANLAIGFAFFYLVSVFSIAPRTNLFLYWSFALLLGYAWRLIFHRVVANFFTRGSVLFIGEAAQATPLQAILEQSTLGLSLTHIYATDSAHDERVHVEWPRTPEALVALINGFRVQAIVLGVDIALYPELKPVIYRALFTSIDILDRAELEEVATGRIPLSHVSEGWFLHHLRDRDRTWYEAVKRGADLLIALPFGVITLALIPLVYVGTKLSSKGPLFYSQNRVGYRGQVMRIWKFRTMHTDSEAPGAQFTSNAKTEPRLFGFGRFMRQMRIDELPQVWNVIKGNLSFVGPRPERPEFVAPLNEQMPYYALRHLARPGLTGWAQVMYLTPTAHLEDNLKKLQYDLYYIKHRSLVLDAAILLKTIGIVLRRQGT